MTIPSNNNKHSNSKINLFLLKGHRIQRIKMYKVSLLNKYRENPKLRMDFLMQLISCRYCNKMVLLRILGQQ